ncbi:hypothetical protein C2845_PM17G12420 [Panicum miliaceum]|uniref:DUF1618 domain-containing protein n=1 Tax=Panicum miliaceum TaxID=4540 RepID=A0A3L6Q3T1_PANMI|nr:hypothetical protein C2845_PM17G12420 [Panicum miliaceum]
MEPLYGSGFSRNVCVTSGPVGGTIVKFVGVFPRCCCGGTGSTHCERSLHAYTVHTWTLRMDAVAWVKDAMVDATELWALDAYEGIPHVPPSRPIVSMDDPDTIFFLVCEWYWYHESCEEDETCDCNAESCEDESDKAGWLILADTRRPALLPPVSCIPDGRLLWAQ